MNYTIHEAYRSLIYYRPYSKMAAILASFCSLANWENILLNFELKNEATKANLQLNKRTLKWWPFWNKVNTLNSLSLKGAENIQDQRM